MDYYSEFINHIAFTVMLLTLQKLFNEMQKTPASNSFIHISVQSLVFLVSVTFAAVP